MILLGAILQRASGAALHQGAPTWTRTRGLLLRRESLYPPELSGPARQSISRCSGGSHGPAMLLSVATAGERGSERRSAPALVSPTFARLAGFVPLVCLGVLEWTRLSAHEGAASGLAWAAVALGGDARGRRDRAAAAAGRGRSRSPR